MSKRFDPYHAWLGIPPHEQPPNHYRLLGISLFESDEDVIQNGLNQRMAHLRTLAAGDHVQEAKQLLAEVSQAGVCLLRPEKKRIYDKRLKSSLQANAETVMARAPLPPASPPPVERATPPVEHATSPVEHATSPVEYATPPASADMRETMPQIPSEDQRPTGGGFPLAPAVTGGIIGLVGACLILFLFSSGGTTSDKVVQVDLTSQNSEKSAELTSEDGTSGAPEPAVDPASPTNNPTTPVPGAPSVPGTVPGAATPQPASEPRSTDAQNPPDWPRPLPMAPEFSSATPAEPDDQQQPASWPQALPGSPLPNTPASPFPMNNTPLPGADPFTSPAQPEAPAKVEGTPKSIVLDLERSSMHVPLVQEIEGKEVQAQVIGFKDFSEPYVLQPSDGILTLNQPVDIVLSQYAGVKIGLSLDRKGDEVELVVAPGIEAEQGSSVDFSTRKIDNTKRAMMKNGNTLSKQLKAAQSEAVALQNAMATPAPAPLRNAQRQRYNALVAQIPQIQNQLAYLQSRQQVLQQLSFLAKQMHEKAAINLVIQVKPASDVE